LDAPAGFVAAGLGTHSSSSVAEVSRSKPLPPPASCASCQRTALLTASVYALLSFMIWCAGMLTWICPAGVNNDFLVKSRDVLAITYNDRSPMVSTHLLPHGQRMCVCVNVPRVCTCAEVCVKRGRTCCLHVLVWGCALVRACACACMCTCVPTGVCTSTCTCWLTVYCLSATDSMHKRGIEEAQGLHD